MSFVTGSSFEPPADILNRLKLSVHTSISSLLAIKIAFGTICIGEWKESNYHSLGRCCQMSHPYHDDVPLQGPSQQRSQPLAMQDGRNIPPSPFEYPLLPYGYHPQYPTTLDGYHGDDAAQPVHMPHTGGPPIHLYVPSHTERPPVERSRPPLILDMPQNTPYFSNANSPLSANYAPQYQLALPSASPYDTPLLPIDTGSAGSGSNDMTDYFPPFNASAAPGPSVPSAFPGSMWESMQ